MKALLVVCWYATALIDKTTAEAINEIFFEVLVAPAFDEDALAVLKSKKNRILLQLVKAPHNKQQYKSLLNGVLMQQADEGQLPGMDRSRRQEYDPCQKTPILFLPTWSANTSRATPLRW